MQFKKSSDTNDDLWQASSYRVIHGSLQFWDPTFLLSGLTNPHVFWFGEQAHVLVWFEVPWCLVNVKVTSGGERHGRTKILIYTVFSLKMSESEIYFFLFPICPEFI